VTRKFRLELLQVPTLG